MMRTLLALMLVACAAGDAVAQTILVPLHEPTVADAVRMARPGDTIVVAADAAGGGRAHAPAGLRIIGTKGARIDGVLHLRGSRLRLRNLQFRDARVRIRGKRPDVRRCTFGGEESLGVSIDGIDARVVNCSFRTTGLELRGLRVRVTNCSFRVEEEDALVVSGTRARVRRNRIEMSNPSFAFHFGPPQWTRAMVVFGDETTVDRNQVLGAESMGSIYGDDVRVTRNVSEYGARALRVHGDRVFVDGNDLRQRANGIDVLGALPVVTNNHVTSDDVARSAFGVGIRVHSDAAGGRVAHNYVSELTDGFDLRLHDAEISSLGHYANGENGDRPSFLIEGDDNRIDSLQSATTYSAVLWLTGSRNEVDTVTAAAGTQGYPPGIRVIGDANVIRSARLFDWRGYGVSLRGDDNTLSESSIQVNAGAGMIVAGDRNRVQGVTVTSSYGYSATPTGGLIVERGDGNVVDDCGIRVWFGDGIALHNAGTRTVVRNCTIRASDEGGEHVRDDGEFAVFENNIVGRPD